jgi:hypothetical protein
MDSVPAFRSTKWTATLDPKHVLALARLLERAGRRGRGARAAGSSTRENTSTRIAPNSPKHAGH